MNDNGYRDVPRIQLLSLLMTSARGHCLDFLVDNLLAARALLTDNVTNPTETVGSKSPPDCLSPVYTVSLVV
ncbi:hypothetical protein LSAT2_020493 [Lamellibrachia satsuma]|nr:hypothetical protein LSAT2_020493 [Lamellibrachia satsuma]